MHGNVMRGRIIHSLRREARDAHRHTNGYFHWRVVGAARVNMGRCDRARHGISRQWRGPGDHRDVLNYPQRFQRNEVRIAGTNAHAMQNSRHDFVTVNCVTGIAVSHPCNRPIGRTLEMAIRVKDPPHASYARANVASPSTVTALATSRPLGARAS